MSFSLQPMWDQRVALITSTREFTLNDAKLLNQMMWSYLEGVTSTTHLIIDLSVIEHFPTRFPDLMQTTDYLRHRRVGWVIVVNPNPNPLANMLAALVTNTVGVNMRFTKTTDEALASLQRLDLTLTEG